MSEITFKEFLEAEKEEISKHKWIESEKVGHDLGVNAEVDWIRKYAEAFRKAFLVKREVKRYDMSLTLQTSSKTDC